MLLQQELKDLSATKGQLAAELSEANGKIHVGPRVTQQPLPYRSNLRCLFLFIFFFIFFMLLEH